MHKGRWRRALMFSLICAWMNSWVNNHKAGDMRRHRAHYDVTVSHNGSVRWNMFLFNNVTMGVCWGIVCKHGNILHWRHNGHDGVSNHQPHGCLLNRLFGRRSKKTSKLRVTGLCARNSPGPVNSPHKWPVTRKMFHWMTSSCFVSLLCEPVSSEPRYQYSQNFAAKKHMLISKGSSCFWSIW